MLFLYWWGHWEDRGGEEGAGGRRWLHRASLAVVLPVSDDFIELVSWRECALHISVSFDLIVGSQEALSHPTFQKIQGGTEGPLWGYPLCKGRARYRELVWGVLKGREVRDGCELPSASVSSFP